jgi:hypothetical protein
MAGRNTTQKPGFLCAVCCEQALKSVGEQNTHGGAVAGAFGLRETARAREAKLRGAGGGA